MGLDNLLSGGERETGERQFREGEGEDRRAEEELRREGVGGLTFGECRN